MKQIRKIPVVLSLVGIFFFPIFFQSFHVYTHHRHPETLCCEHAHHEFPVKIEPKVSVCPILAYDFTTLDLILLWQVPLQSQIVHEVFFAKYQNPDKQIFFCANALRAPPLLLF